MYHIVHKLISFFSFTLSSIPPLHSQVHTEKEKNPMSRPMSEKKNCTITHAHRIFLCLSFTAIFFNALFFSSSSFPLVRLTFHLKIYIYTKVLNIFLYVIVFSCRCFLFGAWFVCKVTRSYYYYGCCCFFFVHWYLLPCCYLYEQYTQQTTDLFRRFNSNNCRLLLFFFSVVFVCCRVLHRAFIHTYMHTYMHAVYKHIVLNVLCSVSFFVLFSIWFIYYTIYKNSVKQNEVCTKWCALGFICFVCVCVMDVCERASM